MGVTPQNSQTVMTKKVASSFQENRGFCHPRLPPRVTPTLVTPLLHLRYNWLRVERDVRLRPLTHWCSKNEDESKSSITVETNTDSKLILSQQQCLGYWLQFGSGWCHVTTSMTSCDVSLRCRGVSCLVKPDSDRSLPPNVLSYDCIQPRICSQQKVGVSFYLRVPFASFPPCSGLDQFRDLWSPNRS